MRAVPPRVCGAGGGYYGVVVGVVLARWRPCRVMVLWIRGCSAVVTRRFGKDANGLWKVCVARPENVGTHGCTHGEHVDMSPQEAQARNERELGVTVTAFSSAKKKGPVKGATRLENIFIGRDGARVKALLGELDNFDYDTNSFVHERFNEAKEKNDDYLVSLIVSCTDACTRRGNGMTRIYA